MPNFRVDDLDREMMTLERLGVRFQTDVREDPSGYRLATGVDPEGNRFQIFEWSRPTPRPHEE